MRLLSGTISLLQQSDSSLGYEAITQSSLMRPVITINRASLFKPVEAILQPQSSQTARKTTPEPSPTIQMTVTELPDSVDRPTTQLSSKEVLETPPKPVIKKVSHRHQQSLISVKITQSISCEHPSRSLRRLFQNLSQPISCQGVPT